MYKRLSIVCLIVPILIGCVDKKQDLEAQLRPVLEKVIFQDSLMHEIDSLKFIRIEPVTDLDIENYRVKRLTNLSNMYSRFAKSHLSMASFHKEVSDTTEFFRTSELAESNKEEKIAKEYQDSAKLYTDEVAAISRKIEGNRLDTVTKKGYFTEAAILGKDRKGFQVRDTIWVLVSNEMAIINLNQIR